MVKEKCDFCFQYRKNIKELGGGLKKCFLCEHGYGGVLSEVKSKTGLVDENSDMK